MSAQQAKESWALLVKEALALQATEVQGGGPGGGAGAGGCGDGGGGEEERRRALHGIGLQMLQWKILLCLENLDAYLPTSVTRLDDPGATEMTCGTKEPPLQHWERALIEKGRLTRAQALLLVEIHRICQENITALREERAVLAAALQELTGGAGRAPLAGDLSGGDGGAEVACLVEDIESNTRCEGRLMLICWQAMPAVFTPVQWARFISHCWPFPAHEAKCCSVLEHALKFSPEIFSPDVPS